VSIRPGWFWHESQNGQVKTPEKLMEIYLSCVGRGANLILNIPPDRRGQIHDNDFASLKGYGEHLRATFAVNLASDAKLQASNTRGQNGVVDPFYAAERLLDGDQWSAWVTDDAVHTPELVVELAGEKTFNLIRLREDIRLGQRVEGIAVDVWDTNAKGGPSWKEMSRAESIGANRLWRVPKTAAKKVRVRVTQSPVAPALSDFGLFLEPEFAAKQR
ncbi:MAG: alpha-L-fucosidase, partial [bacterium]